MAAIGFIGLGIMGRPMALNLIKGGHTLFLHSRSGVPGDLTDAGGRACRSSHEVASQADVVITMVPDTPDVEAVLFGAEGVAEGLSAGKAVVDMSSISPIATKQFAQRIGDLGCEYLDAPVSGGEVGAKNATLSIMVGGSESTFGRIRPIFELMGKNITLVGGNGDGQTCKVANQIVVALTIEAVAEALLFASKAGADPARVRQALMGGFAASRILEVHGERMINRTFDPGFRDRTASEGPQPRAVRRACARRQPAEHIDGPGAVQRLRGPGRGEVGPFGDGARPGEARLPRNNQADLNAGLDVGRTSKVRRPVRPGLAAGPHEVTPVRPGAQPGRSLRRSVGAYPTGMAGKRSNAPNTRSKFAASLLP